MAQKVVVETTINGEPMEFLCEPRQSLLETLRDELELTGSKEGCLTGDCGACTIIVDGRPLCSCLMLGVEAQGKKIQTVEGLAKPDGLHVLQQKFLEHASLQCGICTPGFLMSAKALLDRNPRPTEADIRYALAGNLCRCTGYDKIVRAVTDAAQTLASGTGKATSGRQGNEGTGPSASEQLEEFLQEQEVK
jgi:carbon-monoxide dehydrogenase small subunit